MAGNMSRLWLGSTWEPGTMAKRRRGDLAGKSQTDDQYQKTL
jgi:hypothetical protein